MFKGAQFSRHSRADFTASAHQVAFGESAITVFDVLHKEKLNMFYG
jgi:hypothetical protein